MKKVIVLLSLILVVGVSVSFYTNEQDYTFVQTKDILDPDFFKNELNSAILDFAEDAGIPKDSVYTIH